MKMVFIALALLITLPGFAKNCQNERQQSRELRVRVTDNGQRLDLNYNGSWHPMLTTKGEIAMPRFALERAEIAFLLQVDAHWTLQLLGLDGESMQLGELSEKPAHMCYADEGRNLHLVNASGAITPLPLPAH